MLKLQYSLIFSKANLAFFRVLVENKTLWMHVPWLFECFSKISKAVLPLFLYMFNFYSL